MCALPPLASCSDHGAPGIVGMPSGPFLFADQWLRVLRARSGVGFEHMVIYLEACESGSMFEGLLPKNISVFATTAANARESSWGTYCPGMHPSPPFELMTCLGDLYRWGCELERGEEYWDVGSSE